MSLTSRLAPPVRLVARASSPRLTGPRSMSKMPGSLVFISLLLLSILWAAPFCSAADTDATASVAAKSSAQKAEGATEIEIPASPEEGEGGLRIETEEGYLHYDEESDLIHASRRSRVTYKGMVLDGDAMVVDWRLKEIQASGNVHLVGKNADVYAEKMRYNFATGEGEAYKAYGSYGDSKSIEKGGAGTVYFRYNKKEAPGEPTFESLGKTETLFRRGSISSCDFTIPHYRIQAREILLYPDDRIFFKGATFYVRSVPVLYLPVYSKSMTEGSPWFVRAGYKSSLGPYVRVGYTFHHEKSEPSLEDDKTFVTKSWGKATVFADFLAKRGVGGGATYDYSFNEDAHKGETEFYYLQDSDRSVDKTTEFEVQDRTRDGDGKVVDVYRWTDGELHPGPEVDPQGTPIPGQTAETHKKKYKGKENDTGRYQAVIKHRSALTGHTTWIVNADWVSDPELYYEALDLFRKEERKRVMERRARTALTWAREQFVARLLFEVKDRIGRDRISDFSDPSDNDRDYDVQPEIDIDKRKDRGIPTNRCSVIGR